MPTSATRISNSSTLKPAVLMRFDLLSEKLIIYLKQPTLHDPQVVFGFRPIPNDGFEMLRTRGVKLLPGALSQAPYRDRLSTGLTGNQTTFRAKVLRFSLDRDQPPVTVLRSE